MMHKTSGLIVVEGLEGAGKTTAMGIIARLLQSQGQRVLTVREPGGTPLAEAIRVLLKQEWEEPISGETEILLLYAARLQLVRTVIQPALAHGQWVISDRFELSTFAYQCGGRGVAMETIMILRRWLLGDFDFDLCFFLDCPPEEGLRRVRRRAKMDRFEQESVPFFERVRAFYLKLAENNPKIRVINALNNEKQVAHDIAAAFELFIKAPV
jgi:dTMP kinase